MKLQTEQVYLNIKPTALRKKYLEIKRVIMVVLTLSSLATTVGAKGNGILKGNIKDSLPGLSDKNATPETQLLFNCLKNFSQKGIVFGHHHASVEGQLWKYNSTMPTFNTDVKEVVGDDPGLFGFDFSRGITKYKDQVEAIYKMGGIITYSWHIANPITGKDSHDKTGNPVINILPGGRLHKQWLLTLDTVANYFNSLQVDGKKVPVIFRPFHENTGDWFWWGATSCTPEQYIALWRMTIDYLRKQKNVDNLLIAYSPSKPGTDTILTKAMYPGNDYVDIIGLDIYGNDDVLKSLLINGGRFVSSWAKRENKIPAITEIGIKKGLQNSTTNDWFMSGLLSIFKSDPSIKMAYMLTWRNSSTTSYWVPLKGQPNYESFIKFYNDPYTIFLKDIKKICTNVKRAAKN